MIRSANLGFPRIGGKRELKFATEAYWRGEITQGELIETGRRLRHANWQLQKDIGIDFIPSNDFSFYDQMLDMIAIVGAVPERYKAKGPVDLDLYFAMARGYQADSSEKADSHLPTDVTAMEMTKWFDTNYHYIVPELTVDQTFRLGWTKPVDEFREALALGITTRPVLIGPVTFLLLSKTRGEDFDRLNLLDRLLPVYAQLLEELEAAGAKWVQIDEPVLGMDRTDDEIALYRHAFEYIRQAVPNLRLALTTYFSDLGEHMGEIVQLPIHALHLDITRAPHDLEPLLQKAPETLTLSLGIVDGRNVWRNDLKASLNLLQRAASVVGKERLIVAPSCSLLHVPVDLAAEDALDAEQKQWLAFAQQKLEEIRVLTQAVRGGVDTVKDAIDASAAAIEARRTSPRAHRTAVAEKIAAIQPADFKRKRPFSERKIAQQKRLGLPLLPTTTIGSFPQTSEVRRMRAQFRRGEVDGETYADFLRNEIREVIRVQEEIGLDVLVHGEFERNDMVQYFGEKLAGFAVTDHGWVQSYGTRYVKPPIIVGDVQREQDITVEWSAFAASQTNRPMKGMLTGPVTILQWSFARDDIPCSESCKQIALAIREEVQALEKAGLPIIQVDEPALREGLPLRDSRKEDYLEWAVSCFRLATSGVRDETQIHTHMCYSDFNDIIESIAALDADVISIETSRSDMDLLEVFHDFAYPNDIGPGIYDIHSPRTPSVDEMLDLLLKACAVVSADQLWVNPDCGLKTRTLEETVPALEHLVEAAHKVRQHLSVEKNIR